ncbi:hypothetical protein VTN00DRAFT_2502 [Thermoascus crustaceus]|uniref:uncharacterized protein n=1 Tax=Thermoascus crustaceus TaxID=5088 RepID=UPI0037434E55
MSRKHKQSDQIKEHSCLGAKVDCLGCSSCDASGLEDSDFECLGCALDKVRAERAAFEVQLQKVMAGLAYAQKQQGLLEQHAAQMLEQKLASIDDMAALDVLESENDGASEECSSKRPCHEGPSAGPSSSRGSGEPAPPAETGSPVDYSRVLFWESSLDALFAEGVDPLASGGLDFKAFPFQKS